MSNRVEIEANGFGFTVSDDYASCFVAHEKADEISDPLEIVKLCLKGIDIPEYKDILTFCQEMRKGISINGNWYDYDELEQAFEDMDVKIPK